MMSSDFTDRHLIFIVSQPRAGSTLLQSLLAGCEGVHTTAEPWLMLHPLYARRETGHTADYDATLAARALDDFLGQLKEGAAAYDAAVRAMAVSYTHLDVYKRQYERFGFRAGTDFDEGLRRTIEWYRQTLAEAQPADSLSSR